MLVLHSVVLNADDYWYNECWKFVEQIIEHSSNNYS